MYLYNIYNFIYQFNVTQHNVMYYYSNLFYIMLCYNTVYHTLLYFIILYLIDVITIYLEHVQEECKCNQIMRDQVLLGIH